MAERAGNSGIQNHHDGISFSKKTVQAAFQQRRAKSMGLNYKRFFFFWLQISI
ncbi:hypothetical protein HMPREF9098_2374 [Kingella denitrificans ATCC 33394]|uniref:Uncharacterized protein n=1 Tax=Kingella denitrificans ATCC 33394 TaxID=888741 RepID=F0F2M8_9NEIS|nr:hypothetical protein HMPREF9098_2374 [Kingella denitrificans ATCC 33394]